MKVWCSACEAWLPEEHEDAHGRRRSRNMNPPPGLKDPNRVTDKMVESMVNRFVDLRYRGHVSPGVTSDAQKAMDLARKLGMFFVLESPQARIRKGTDSVWTCSIPPAKGQTYRNFRAKTPAKATCSAILDFLDHPAV
jgi:hypothetical protein